MNFLIAAPFFLQGIAMFIDEFYFHRKRGLPKWERIGHPIDTFSVLVCFLYLAIHQGKEINIPIYLSLSIFSCLLITKDEFIHRIKCNGAETWLHSILFILHPVVLYCAFISTRENDLIKYFYLQFSMAIAMFVYQIIYWNFYKVDQTINNDIYESLGERWYTAYDDPVALLRQESKVKVPWVIHKMQNYNQFNGHPKILDVGCGAGFLSNALSLAGYEVVGLDLSEESLRVAQKHDQSAKVKYIPGDAYALPFPDASFDVITSMDFLEHIDDPERAISEISRVLKPNGLFFFHTFNRNWLSFIVIIKLVEWIVANTPKNMHVLKLFIKPSELNLFCHHHNMKIKEMTGIKPKFSTISISSVFTGVVPENFSFELTPSLKLSYMGYATKN